MTIVFCELINYLLDLIITVFVSKFLNKMDSISDQDGISRICKEAYSQTLAKFHPWLIQKGAGIAMLGLPTKKDLIAKVKGFLVQKFVESTW